MMRGDWEQKSDLNFLSDYHSTVAHGRRPYAAEN